MGPACYESYAVFQRRINQRSRQGLNRLGEPKYVVVRVPPVALGSRCLRQCRSLGGWRKATPPTPQTPRRTTCSAMHANKQTRSACMPMHEATHARQTMRTESKRCDHNMGLRQNQRGRARASHPSVDACMKQQSPSCMHANAPLETKIGYLSEEEGKVERGGGNWSSVYSGLAVGIHARC